MAHSLAEVMYTGADSRRSVLIASYLLREKLWGQLFIPGIHSQDTAGHQLEFIT